MTTKQVIDGKLPYVIISILSTLIIGAGGFIINNLNAQIKTLTEGANEYSVKVAGLEMNMSYISSSLSDIKGDLKEIKTRLTGR